MSKIKKGEKKMKKSKNEAKLEKVGAVTVLSDRYGDRTVIFKNEDILVLSKIDNDMIHESKINFFLKERKDVELEDLDSNEICLNGYIYYRSGSIRSNSLKSVLSYLK